MSDNGNPFARLAREFAARRREAKKDSTPGDLAQGIEANLGPPGPSTRSGPAPQGARKPPPSGPTWDHPASPGPERETDSEDAALFLRAVGRIKPENRRGGRARTGDGTGLDRAGLNGMGRATGALAGPLARAGTRHDMGHALRHGAGPDKEQRAGADFSQSRRGSGVNTSAGADEAAASDEALMHAAFAGLSGSTGSGPNGQGNTQDAKDAAQVMNDEERAAFARAMRGVAPVHGKGRDIAAPSPPVPPGEGGPAHDPARALRDVLEGRVEFALHHTDEFMEGYVLGVDPLVLARLRAGQYSPEAHLDLHGMNARQAYDALTWFIKNSYGKGLRTLVVITGRGRNSPDGIGVLRPMLQRWLSREPFKRVVLAFCTAKPHDGGPGAVYVLLRKYKKSRGKIIWEHTPSDEDFPDL